MSENGRIKNVEIGHFYLAVISHFLWKKPYGDKSESVKTRILWLPQYT